jgi:hypothetical protein
MAEWTPSDLLALPEGTGMGAAGDPFQFDRPAEHGLAPRTYGEGSFPGAEAREAAADRLRDALLVNYDPSEELTRMAEASQTPQR